jgi:glycosyltransferase involved in cell wall biosynthesis
MTKVVLITNIPAPYRIPLLNELSAQLATDNIQFKVVFGALSYPRRSNWKVDPAEWRFASSTLDGSRRPGSNPDHGVFTYSGLARVLRAESPALVIITGFSMATIKVWFRSLVCGMPYLIWSGAINRKGRPDSRLRRLQRRVLIARARGCIAYGTAAKEYLIELGVDPARVYIGINTVDVDFFQQESTRLRAKGVRDESSPKRILYVGNLEAGKRIDQLVSAVSILAKQRNDFVLEIVGSGSQEESIRSLVQNLQIDNCVVFSGFLQRPEVARCLASACCFVFPSEYDIWGLVVVEAMAAGLPCLSSVYAGATRDLIREEVTGFALDFSLSDAVADRL